MRTINTTFTTFGASVLLLGYKGDSNATEILIDCASALEEYDGTMAAMSITGPDETVYPGDITMDENGIVHWVVAARDCGKAGHGSARIDLVDDHDTVVASAEATTIIMKTKMQGIAPDQIADWTEAASVALQELRDALLDLHDFDDDARVNEDARQLAEEGRISREQQRATAETARATAESERAAAETARETAETGRATAESGRVTAESGRVTAETARVTEFNTIRANAQAALSYIGPSEASSTASAPHPSGSYFTFNGILYKATADIASGDTITPGTNCAQVPGGAMGEVSDLKSAVTNAEIAGGIYTGGYEQGAINANNGTNNDNYPNVRIRTPGYIPVVPNMELLVKGSNLIVLISMCAYNSNNEYVGTLANNIYVGTGGNVESFDISAALEEYPTAKYIRYAFRKQPEANIDASEGDSIAVVVWNKIDNREEAKYTELEQNISELGTDLNQKISLLNANSSYQKIALDEFLNAAYFRMSDSKYIKYTSQTDTYGLYKAVPVLDTETKIHIRCYAVNTIPAKIAFLNSSTFATESVVGLWTNSATGEFDVPIPDGTKYVCIANECNTSGVAVGDPEAYFLVQDVYNAIVKNRDDIAELGDVSSYESLTYTDRFNSQRRDALTNTIAKLKDGTLNYTVLGDSITDTWDGHNHSGGGASNAAHGYAKIVYRWLKQKYGNSLQFTNNGTGGITIAGTMEVVDQYIENQGFDLCVVELGTNDWNVQTPIATFKANFKALLNRILEYTNAPEIFIIGLGYFGDWHSERAIKEKEYNDALREIATEYNVPFADPYDGMKEEIDFGTYTFADITYEPDPVHPNDTGHRIWANEVYNVFSEIMK